MIAAAAVVIVPQLSGTPSQAAPSSSHTASAATRGDAAAAQFRLSVRFAHVSGTTIAWAQAGHGRPLLMLNGTGSPMAEWDPALLASLTRSRRVIVFDYPGLGLSG